MWIVIFAPIGVCHDVSCILMSFFLNNFAYLLSLSLKYILLITILTTKSIRIIHYFFSSSYVPAENLTDLDPGITFTHLDATTILSRGLVAKGIHP